MIYSVTQNTDGGRWIMGKRMNGEGTIRRRKDGRYELRMMVGYQENGKQKVVSFYGDADFY